MAAILPSHVCPLELLGVPSSSFRSLHSTPYGWLPSSNTACASSCVLPSRRASCQGVCFSRSPRKGHVQRLPHRIVFKGELGLTLLQPYDGLLKTSRISVVLLGTAIALTSNGRTYTSGWQTLQSQKRNHRSFSIICMAPHRGKVGRVGTHNREGNISLASFGIRPKKGLGGKNMDFTKSLSGMLPYVVVATAFAALVQPATFAWVSKEYYAPALGGIMLSIGVQLSVKDFALVLQRPTPVLVGYIAQYVVKPLLGVVVARAFNVPPAFAAGFILMASVAGAQLSSYASFLSEGDVALSIVLTSLSTITSVVVTPVLTGLLIGSVVPVDAFAMAKSILQVVLCPVLMGLALNTYAKSAVDVVRPLMPLMAMVCTSMCIGSPLSLNRAQIASMQGVQLLVPVVAFHTVAFAVGYWVSRIPALRLDEKVSRTLSLCTGMQSSTLAGLLASQFLGSSQAVPPACSVVVMAVIGLSLASFWGSGSRIRDVFKRHRGILNIAPCEADTPFSPQGLRKMT